MSITTFHPSEPLTWKQADADVHVATRAGEFAGFVEFDGNAHRARDAHGVDLGAFATLDDARNALEVSRSIRQRIRNLPTMLPQTFRRRPRRVSV